MKWAELVSMGREGGGNLLGAKHKPEFWRDMALNNQNLKRKVERDSAEKASVREVVREKEVIVKVRCPYCKKLYEETENKCPNCGA